MDAPARTRRRLAAGALALGLAALAPGTGPGRAAEEGPAPLGPGDHVVSLVHQGRERSARVHVPPAARAGAPLPVVLSFHGGGGNARAHEAWTAFDPVADAEGLVAVYPDGTGRLSGRLLTWNAGACCGYAQAHDVDDVGFVVALLAELAARLPLDRTRVYATGMSNGAMMAYRLAARIPGRLAAIAPVAGMGAPPDDAARRPAVPILHVHSVDDPRALYEGGLGPPFPLTGTRVRHLPVEATLAAWRDAFACPGAAEADAPVAAAAAGDSGAEQEAQRLRWGPCRDGAEVVLWKLRGAGHVWPGAPPRYGKRLLGEPTRVIDANREMVAFFRRFARPDAPPLAPPLAP